MPAPEAARNDLYNGLTELLGPERAETLMAYLPLYDPNEVARRSDVDRMETRLDRLEDRIDRLEDRIDLFRIETTARFDRLGLSLIGWSIVIIATVIGTAFV